MSTAHERLWEWLSDESGPSDGRYKRWAKKDIWAWPEWTFNGGTVEKGSGYCFPLFPLCPDCPFYNLSAAKLRAPCAADTYKSWQKAKTQFEREKLARLIRDLMKAKPSESEKPLDKTKKRKTQKRKNRKDE